MKISYRILIINFAIVALILGASAVAFYSIMYNVLATQQSKYLLNSANEFIYSYRNFIQDADDEFRVLENKKSLFVNGDTVLSTNNLDFLLQAEESNPNVIVKRMHKEGVSIPSGNFTIQQFLTGNPYTIVSTAKLNDGKIYYYGRIISDDLLNNLAKKINAEVALVWKGTPVEVSNHSPNQKYSYLLTQAYKHLAPKNNFETYTQRNETADILATIYKPSPDFKQSSGLQFLIFTPLNEAANLRTSLKDFLIIIGLAGVILSLILTLVFTDKIRRQITKLSKATEVIKEGNLRSRITIQSNDELGRLGSAFNNMLDQLQKNEKAKNEYSEFITLINRNPTLSEIADAALKKIIKTAGFAVGALYSVDNGTIALTSSFGFDEGDNIDGSRGIFNEVIKTHESVEISSEERLPLISAGMVDIKLKHLLIMPVIYNNRVIAIMELGAVEKPDAEAVEYLSKIQEQLAIGLTNATAFVQLENLVTELKKLNEDYQKQNVQIRKQNETLVELHKKLKEKADELEIQKQKAEEATELKSNFLASMSHELRTPMNSILGLTELILDDTSLSTKNRERIEVVLKSGRRLMNLINDILDLSKIEAGKMEIHDEDVFLEEMIKDVEVSLNPLVSQKDIEFKVTRDINTRIIINTDRGKITQVLINLLGNAVKFTENGYVELKISTIDDNYLKFEIIDTGIGISEEDQKIIFEEFRQIDGTTTRKYSGTGLGLAICKKITELMGGEISVKSTRGQGSNFSFTVPLRFIKVKEIEDNPHVNIDTLRKNRRNPILIIDDDPDIRYTIGQYLISKGYEVMYASDGQSGVKQARKIQPFAITLDAILPNKDGWNTLKELKENPETKDIPVILISIMGDKNVGFGLGAYEYFVKPIDPKKLLGVFNKLEKLAQKRIEKIVIVDDDELEFEKFKNAFKNDKIRIEFIKDSELAFSKILEVQPDLAIIDLMMPKVDGITLSYKLKSNADTKHIPIIISTAKDLSDDEKNSLSVIVEEITVKSKGHPLDVLKVVRDRIKMQEAYVPSDSGNEDEEKLVADTENSFNDNVGKEYKGEVLIVDDDSDTLFTISEIVQACECKTVLAKNGVECLKVLEKKTPDLILLDIMMPEMDGFQTISRIRKNPKWAGIPIFAVTAKAMLDDKAVILRHGFDDYIPKPINSGVMAFKIEKLFSKHRIS